MQFSSYIFKLTFVESKNGNVNKKVIKYYKMAIEYIKTVKYQKYQKIHTFYKRTYIHRFTVAPIYIDGLPLDPNIPIAVEFTVLNSNMKIAL